MMRVNTLFAYVVVALLVAREAVAAQPSELTVDQMLASLTPSRSILGNDRAGETALHYALAAVASEGVYHANAEDTAKLIDVMNDEARDHVIRLCCARYLLDLENARARQFVSQGLQSRDVHTLHNSAEALRSHVARAAGERRKVDWGCEQIVALIKTDRLLEPYAEQIRKGESFSIESRSWYSETFNELCRAVGEAKYRPAVPVLAEILGRIPDSGDAAWALGEIGDASVILALLKTMKDTDGDLRPEWVEALGRLHAKEAVPAIVRYVESDGEPQHQLAEERLCIAANALGRIADPHAIAPLKAAVARWDAGAHQTIAARIALANLDSTDAVVALLALLESSKESYPQLQVIWALGEHPDAREVAPLLELARWSPHVYVRVHAIRTLGAIGGARVVEGLVGLFQVDFEPLRSQKDFKVFPDFPGEIADALRAASGEKFGDKPGEWRAWLRRTGKKR